MRHSSKKTSGNIKKTLLAVADKCDMCNLRIKDASFDEHDQTRHQLFSDNKLFLFNFHVDCWEDMPPKQRQVFEKWKNAKERYKAEMS